MTVIVIADAATFSYRFDATPLPKAIQRIIEDHPELEINFIYNELENYFTSATVSSDNALDALRQTVGFNPVSVTKSKDTYYLEALQHGRFSFIGRAASSDSEPVVAATVMLLTPKDSTFITYGITDASGRFSIPCDRHKVIAKLSCVGYKTTYHYCNSFDIGTITLQEQTINLNSVTVQAENAHLYADRTIYIPTQRQKNASQSGDELLSHMAIPQLGIISGGSITTNSGRSVAVYIDYLPASDNELKAMNVKDVRKVEFYTSPSDPRFQGNEYVVNFIMQQYQYGGYVKGFSHINLISYSEQLLASTRFQYKKMKYDFIASAWNMNSSHYGSDITESFRLPGEDGLINEFNRHSITTRSKKESQQYFAGFKATYTSDRILAATEIDGNANDNPHSDMDGSVSYIHDAFPASTYSSTLDEKSRFLSVSGHYYFELSDNDALTFKPDYVFSHTEQASAYSETSFPTIYNAAVDNTNELSATLNYTHNFGDVGNILAFTRADYEYNRTAYTGSVCSYDKAKSVRVGGGVNYTVTHGNFCGLVGFGYNWDHLKFGQIEDKTASPWADLSTRLLLKQQHSLSLTFHYSTWQPSSSYKSANVIVASPFMKYTGNPKLIPYKAYDIGLDYTWIPDNRFNMAVFAYSWFVGDRYAFDFQPTSDGILRTIRQPIGRFADIKYGVNSTASFLDNNLDLTAQVAQVLNRDGEPFNKNHSFIYWHARLRYYINNWNLALTYISDNAKSDGCVNGYWTKSKSDWQITVGWSNRNWNVKTNLINLTRWNWRSDIRKMHTKFYSVTDQQYSGHSHALIQVSATYTFGYGKKVQRDNEPYVSGNASSGILH